MPRRRAPRIELKPAASRSRAAMPGAPVVQELQPPALRQQTKRPTGRAALNASSDAPESAHSAGYTQHRRSAGDAVNSPGVVRLS